ncbi:MAG: hypothetical protein LBD20_02250 [Spirochaetaceae bacterium]|jgi:hypothetical protein|nr:hypothetical protein [Spirochaetaceae bacterium]
MANYLDVQKEETLKAAVFRDYFDKAQFAYEPNIGNIDFVVADCATGGLFKAHYICGRTSIIHSLSAAASRGVLNRIGFA